VYELIRLLALAITAAVITSIASASTADTNASLWTTLESSSIYAKYARANPGEADKIKRYWLNGGAKPVVATQFGIFLVEVNEDRVVPVPPPPPPVATVTQTIADGSTIPDIRNWRAVYDANGDGVEDDPGKIDFRVDGALVLSEVNAPFGDTFATGTPSVGEGQHTFKVDAVNDTGVLLASSTVTASVSGGQPPPPPPTGYPNATNTGVPVGTALNPRTGNLTVSANNTVVDAITMTGCITVTGYGVTIKNSRVGCVVVDGGPASNPANPRLTIQDTEIVCPLGSWNTGFRFDNTLLLRVNIHGCENGMDIGNNVTLQDSFIHDLAPGATFHNDGIQGVPNNSTIEHNTIYGIDTSAIGFNSDAGANNVLINNNLLAGGGWTLYCPKGSHPTFRVTNNHFSTIFYPKVGAYGTDTDCAGEIMSGNVIHETGAPVG
jgi:hypothetical protein